MKKSYFWGLLLAILALIPSQNAFADYCTKSGNSSHTTRYLPSFTLTDGTNDAVVSNIQTGTKQALYQDKTSVVLETEAGATLSFKELTWNGEWMHGYVFIDYNNNQEFENTTNELVSYNFYSEAGNSTGLNSKGETVSNNCGVNATNMPSWDLPLDLAAGDYRMRFNVAWNTIEPCGYANMAEEGGAMVDVTIRIASKAAARTISVSVNQEETGTVTINGEAVSSLTAEGGIRLVATPAEGYKFVNWTVEGVEVSTNATYIDGTDGDKAYVANFAAKDVYQINVSANDASLGSVATTQGEVVYEGDEITFTATAADGCEFVNWTVGGVEVGTNATLTVTATTDADYVANFRVKPTKLAITSADISLQAYGSYVASNIIDGKYNTYFDSNNYQSNGATVAVTLAEESFVGQVKLYFNNSYRPSTAKIQVSTDNSI